MQAALPFFIADGAQSQDQQFLRLQYGINIAGIPLRITKGSIQLRDGPFLFAFRLLADIHPALGSGGCFQLLQGQLDGGVAVARRKDIFPLLRSYSVMAQTRAGRPVAPSMRG